MRVRNLGEQRRTKGLKRKDTGFSHAAGCVIEAIKIKFATRGVASPEGTMAFGPYNGTPYFTINIYADGAEFGLSFQYYSASLNGIFYLDETIDISPPNPVGGVTDPVLLHVKSSVDLTIPLSKGWKYLSLNVETDNMEVSSVLSAPLTDYDMFIQSQSSGFTQYYSQWSAWSGSLATLDVTEMYMLRMGDPDDTSGPDFNVDLVVNGMPVDVSATPISFVDGWNWISYLPQNSGDVQTALASVSSLATSSDNMYVTSQSDGFTQYYPAYGMWSGSLTNMQPGSGYMMSTSYAGELTYPEFDDLTRSTVSNESMDQSDNLFAEAPDWSFNEADYDFNSGVTAIVSLDGIVQDGDGDLLASFAPDGTLRGVSEDAGKFTFGPFSGTTYFELQVYGGTEETDSLFTFQYYSVTNDMVYDLNALNSQIADNMQSFLKGGDNQLLLAKTTIENDAITSKIKIISTMGSAKISENYFFRYFFLI